MWGLLSMMYLHLGSMNEASHLPCSRPLPPPPGGGLYHTHCGRQATQGFSVGRLSWPCPRSDELGPKSLVLVSQHLKAFGESSSFATHSACLPASPHDTKDDQKYYC